MATSTLKDLVHKIFVIPLLKKQRIYTTDPLEMIFCPHDTELCLNSTFKILLTPALSDCVQPEIKYSTVPVLCLPGIWSCWWFALCLRCYWGLCTNCSNAIGIQDTPEMLQKLSRHHLAKASGQRCEQEQPAPTRDSNVTLSKQLGFIVVPLYFPRVSWDFPSS